MSTHSKAHIHKVKIPLLGLGLIFMSLLFLLIFRGWLRVTIIPKTASLFYLNNVASALDKENNSLGDPFNRLGFSSVPENKKCVLQQAQSFHTEIDCQAVRQSYTKLPAGASELSNETQQAVQLQQKLETLGWQAGSNGVTLSSLIRGIGHSIDYSPDANYEKIIGKTDCVFDLMIAYSNPQPPAIRAMFFCDRTLDFLGAPKAQFYNSTKGHM